MAKVVGSKEFYERAAQLGHSREDIDRAGQFMSTVVVHSMAELKKLVQPKDAKVRADRQATLDALAKATDKELPLEHHVNAYLYGNSDLSPENEALCAKTLPMSLTVLSVTEDTLPPGETVIGPSGNPVVWNYDTLRIPDGSWITTRTNNFTLNVTNLVMQATNT
jgi:hypothetical protein